MYKIKNNHGISTMLQFFGMHPLVLMFCVCVVLFVCLFSSGVRETYLWYCKVARKIKGRKRDKD